MRRGFFKYKVRRAYEEMVRLEIAAQNKLSVDEKRRRKDDDDGTIRAITYRALYRHRRRHVHRAGMGAPALKTTASESRSL